MSTADGTQFQVATDTDFTTKLIDYSGVYKASHDVPTGTLTRGVQLYARVRHSSVETGYGAWSPTRQFSVRPFVGFVSILMGGGNSSTNATLIDTSGNIYLLGYNNNRFTGIMDTVLYKFSSDGTLLLKKRIYDATNHYNESYWNMTIDPSNNIYMFGADHGYGTYIGILKLTNTGTLLWKKTFSAPIVAGTIGNDCFSTGATMDSAGYGYFETYTQHYTSLSGATSILFIDTGISKIDAAGTVMWTRRVKSATGDITSVRLFPLTVAANGNIYGVGFLKYTTGIENAILVKCDPTGTSYWIKQLYSTTTERGTGIATDTSSNIYIVTNNISTVSDGKVLKLSADGSLIWSKAITFPGYTKVYWNSVRYSDSYIYLSGQATSDKTCGIVAKLDLNGNLIWAAVLSSTTYPMWFNGCTKLLNGQLTVFGGQTRNSLGQGILSTISTNADNCTGVLPNLTDLSWSTLTNCVIVDVGVSIVTPSVTWYNNAPTNATMASSFTLTIEDQTGLTVLSSQY